MAVMTEEAPERTAVRRPASGIAVDPRKVTWWRDRRALSRQELSDRITELDLLPFRHREPPADGHAVEPVMAAGTYTCAACGAPVTGGLSRDALAKIENGTRRPKARTLRAICTALSTDEETCRPEDLMPGGPPLAPHPDAEARRRTLEHNQAMRDFADALGREDLYRRPSGRIRYQPELREMYAEYLAEAGGGGTPQQLAS